MYKIAVVLCFLTVFTYAQTNESKPFSFETPFYEAVDKWVLFASPDGDNAYALGFVYIDREAGFTIDFETILKLENGKLVNPDAGKKKDHSSKVRLSPNTPHVHILTANQLNDLNLATPDWLEIYKRDSETDAYKIRMASLYNSVGGNTIALGILKNIYSHNKTDKKLLFELAYAYNALERFTEAVEVLDAGLSLDDTDDLFYKEKHFALVRLGNMDAAKTTYDTYLKKAKNKRYRSEMVYNMIYPFFEKRNKKDFDHWAKELRSFEKSDHVFIKNLDVMIEYWDQPLE